MGYAARVWITVLVLLLGGALLIGSAGASPARSGHVQRLATLEQGILEQVNGIRAAHGLRVLSVSSALESAAVNHSQSMLSGGFFRHESKDGSSFEARLRRFYPIAGFSRWAVGENLVYSSSSLSATAAVKAWLRSAPHRRDMLSAQWREVGIGALHSESAGGSFKQAAVWIVTMDFGSRSHG